MRAANSELTLGATLLSLGDILERATYREFSVDFENYGERQTLPRGEFRIAVFANPVQPTQGAKICHFGTNRRK